MDNLSPRSVIMRVDSFSIPLISTKTKRYAKRAVFVLMIKR